MKTLYASTSAFAVMAFFTGAMAQDVCNGNAPCAESASTGSPVISVTNSGSGRAATFARSATTGANPVVGATSSSTADNAIGVTSVMSSNSAGHNSAAVRGINNGEGFIGIDGGRTVIPIGVWGSQRTGGIGVRGDSPNGTGLSGTGGTGVRGEGTGVGIFGTGPTGVSGSGQSGGDGVFGFNNTLAGRAATFQKGSLIRTPGTLATVQVANGLQRGEGLWIALDNAANPDAVIKLILHRDATGNYLECHKPDGSRKCRITNQGTFVSGSDFAEALPARRGAVLAPGDVLAMTDDGAAVEKAAMPYSARLVGVYSTRPGVLGADKDGETRVDPDDVPVAIMGIVPTKVTADEHAIAVGDMLVASAQPGYAMKGTDRSRMPGATVGKALEPLSSGTGVIKVLVGMR